MDEERLEDITLWLTAWITEDPDTRSAMVSGQGIRLITGVPGTPEQWAIMSWDYLRSIPDLEYFMDLNAIHAEHRFMHDYYDIQG